MSTAITSSRSTAGRLSSWVAVLGCEAGSGNAGADARIVIRIDPIETRQFTLALQLPVRILTRATCNRKGGEPKSVLSCSGPKMGDPPGGTTGRVGGTTRGG